MSFVIERIPADVLASVRATGTGHDGVPAARATANGGEPVRCCLTDARPGDELILFGYAPPLPDTSPYQETGAVYAHAGECPTEPAPDRYPSDWYGRPQVLRAYDRRGWIHPSSRTHDGRAPEREIAEILADPDVVEVHSRNIVYGCYMFTVRRATT